MKPRTRESPWSWVIFLGPGVASIIVGYALVVWSDNGDWRFAKTDAIITGKEPSVEDKLRSDSARRILQDFAIFPGSVTLPAPVRCDIDYTYHTPSGTFYGKAKSLLCAVTALSVWYSTSNPEENYLTLPESGVLKILGMIIGFFGAIPLYAIIIVLVCDCVRNVKKQIKNLLWLEGSRYMGNLSKHQRLCVLFGITAVGILLLFPPHVGNAIIQDGDNIHTPIGHHFIFSTPSSQEVCNLMKNLGLQYRGRELSCDYYTYTSNLDFSRLITEALIAFLAIAVVFLATQKKTSEQKAST